MNTGLKNYTDEELVEIYKEGNEEVIKELLKSTEKLRYSLAQKYLNIPKSEMEDLMSEGVIEMLSAIQKYDRLKYTASFKSFLYVSISRHYDDLFRAAVSAKRNPRGVEESYEQVNSNSEFNEEGDSLGNSVFSVTCEGYGMAEMKVLLEKLELSEKERIVVNLLIDGRSKPDIAQYLGIKTPSVHTYIKRIGNKLNLSGVFA